MCFYARPGGLDSARCGSFRRQPRVYPQSNASSNSGYRKWRHRPPRSVRTIPAAVVSRSFPPPRGEGGAKDGSHFHRGAIEGGRKLPAVPPLAVYKKAVSPERQT